MSLYERLLIPGSTDAKVPVRRRDADCAGPARVGSDRRTNPHLQMSSVQSRDAADHMVSGVVGLRPSILFGGTSFVSRLGKS